MYFRQTFSVAVEQNSYRQHCLQIVLLQLIAIESELFHQVINTVHQEILFVLKTVNCLMRTELIKIIHQQFVMKLQNGKI